MLEALPDPPTVPVAEIAAGVTAALVAAWNTVRARHPGVPEAVISMATGGRASAVELCEVGRSMELAFHRGPGARAQRALTRVRHEGHPAAHRAANCLEELRVACSAGDDNLGEQQAFRSAATTALDDVPSLTNEQKHLLVLDATWPPLDPALREIITARANAVRDLVSAARTVLGADRS